jgi:CBS domain-containing protein
MAQTLRDIMTTEVRTISPSASCFEAARLMKDLDVGIVPVVDGELLVGVVTDRDIVVRVVSESRDPLTSMVSDAMSTTVTTATPDWDIKHTANVMSSEQIRRLPVVEIGRLVGIVSLGDLAVEGNKDSLSGQTLSEISVPAQPRK